MRFAIFSLPLLSLFGLSQLSAFEQGSYFVFDLRAESKGSELAGCIHLTQPKTPASEAPAASPTAEKKQSEFVIDFGSSFGTPNSAFDFSEDPADTKQAPRSTQSFGLGNESSDFSLGSEE
ncbi:hypothetical protein [Coraliomargarita parva]|uniref:hypothetical protein n=1 Tax=Coraliomargarita parva TaxID=3014050 RepID=UPI0022B2D55C|nr:hypothetical protein [Coraliomargarita parva]